MLFQARMYQTEGQAANAANALIEAGFSKNSVTRYTPPSAAAGGEMGGGPASDSAAALRVGGILGEHAGYYADHVNKGYSLVAVQPPFGTMLKAEKILDAHNPLPLSHMPPPEPFVPWTERPAAFSSLFGWPTLTRSETPFSDFWGLSTKQEGLSHFSRWFKPLTDGLRMGSNPLTANATPLSSMVGMGTQSSRNAGKTGSFGMSFKTKGATPFSSMIGMPTLTKRKHFLTS